MNRVQGPPAPVSWLPGSSPRTRPGIWQLSEVGWEILRQAKDAPNPKREPLFTKAHREAAH
jgi:hypothetical protein